MSELRLRKIQLGVDTQNPENNITIETPPISDGTMKIRTGSAQGTGTDMLNIGSDFLNYNSDSNTKPFSISRLPSMDNQILKIGIEDGSANFNYTNDEAASSVFFRIENTDTETGNGAVANTNIFAIKSSNGILSCGSQSTVDMAFISAGVERMRLDTSGRLVLTNSLGIDFQSGGTSSTLDDYEEGTWTPSLTAGGSPVYQVNEVAGAKYTKIGNTVVVNFNLNGNTNIQPSSTSAIFIEGLPFPASSDGGFPATSPLVRGFPITGYIVTELIPDDTRLLLLNCNSDAGTSTILPNQVQDSYSMNLTFTYMTDS